MEACPSPSRVCLVQLQSSCFASYFLCFSCILVITLAASMVSCTRGCLPLLCLLSRLRAVLSSGLPALLYPSSAYLSRASLSYAIVSD